MKAVMRKDGRAEEFMPRVSGVAFQCNCTCNVFHKPDDTKLDLYECNSCGAWYRAEDTATQERQP